MQGCAVSREQRAKVPSKTLSACSAPRLPLQAADVWSCGVLLYILCTGCCPFQRATDAGLDTRERMMRLLQVGQWAGGLAGGLA